MLIGCAQVSRPDDSQVLDLQKDALIKAGVSIVDQVSMLASKYCNPIIHSLFGNLIDSVVT